MKISIVAFDQRSNASLQLTDVLNFEVIHVAVGPNAEIGADRILKANKDLEVFIYAFFVIEIVQMIRLNPADSQRQSTSADFIADRRYFNNKSHTLIIKRFFGL